MIYTKQTKLALRLCFEAHRNQVDRSGLPYVFHPFHLAEQLETEEEVAAALLHDVVEDTDCTLEDLRQQGVSQPVLEALALLTHREGEEYLEYVCRAGTNPIAIRVKLADLTHNSDLSRLNTVTERDRRRREKYALCIRLLQSRSVEGNRCRYSLPLREEDGVWLSIACTAAAVESYTIESEREGLSLRLQPEKARILRTALPGDELLPMQLAAYLKTHSCRDLAALLKAAR